MGLHLVVDLEVTLGYEHLMCTTCTLTCIAWRTFQSLPWIRSLSQAGNCVFWAPERRLGPDSDMGQVMKSGLPSLEITIKKTLMCKYGMILVRNMGYEHLMCTICTLTCITWTFQSVPALDLALGRGLQGSWKEAGTRLRHGTSDEEWATVGNTNQKDTHV